MDITMSLTTAVLLLLGGFVCLVIGGEALVRAAISIAVRTSISPAIISLTIVAAGTSAPEMVTSVIAALQGKPDIAVGNVAGSNIFNILAILGISFLIYPAKSIGQKLNFEWATLFIFTGITYFFIRDLNMAQWEGGFLVAGFVAVILASVMLAKKKGFNQDDEDEEISALSHPAKDVIYLVIGMGALVFGAQLALKGGVFIGEWLGWSEKVIGVTIISVGTGLPELATSAVAAFRGRSDIAVGNVLGSNIMNTLAVLGGAALITPLSIAPQILSVDMIALLAFCVLLWPVANSMRFSLGRGAGFGYLGLYVFYIYGTLANWVF